MNVGQAQTLVNDNDELNEPQDIRCRTGQHSDTISTPEICLATFIILHLQTFPDPVVLLSCWEEVLDSEARANRVRTIKESLLSKRDSQKDTSGSNVITRNPI